MNNNVFVREISDTQSKYKLIKKNVTQQSSYNLSVELENYLYENGALKKIQIPGKETDGNVYYTLNDDVKLSLGEGIINIIGTQYKNVLANLILVHTTNNNKFQIRRNDHNNNDACFNWFREVYDKNFEGANFIVDYDKDNKILKLNNTISNSKLISKAKSEDDAPVANEYLNMFKTYYLNNLHILKENEDEYIKVRDDFLHEYPIEKIKELSLDEYCLGNENNEESFCYKLEFGKYRFAGPGIGGKNASKFGIYRSKQTQEYIYDKKVVENVDEFWDSFKEQLYYFLKEYETCDEPFSATDKYPLLKGMNLVLTKLLFIYYPDKFINICKKASLELLLRYCGYSYNKNMQNDELSFVLNKKIRKDIDVLNDNDPRYIGSALWHFIKEIIEAPDTTDDVVNDIEEENYSKNQFLSEVFMSESEYNELINLIVHKKNIILQGSPGVGKTFMAKRLAYSIIGKKAKNQILSVQFHQSYSYEDFIEGIRPNDDGTFNLVEGVFKEFVNKAKDNRNKQYFCIIDEINRGNLSKILGELMKLIESDKRDIEDAILPYSKESFIVPSNLYIIGTMNTADRSLAMVDYALRRRFAFYKVQPAFNKSEFKDYLINTNGLSEQHVASICNKLININELISKDLGQGFEIGHSYFVDTLNESEYDSLYNSIIQYEIKPLLEEYWYDDENKVNEYKDML